jgi:hypothetical protein
MATMIGVAVPPLTDDLTAQVAALIAISAIAGAIAPRTVPNRAREGLIATSEPSGERPRCTRPCILGSAHGAPVGYHACELAPQRFSLSGGLPEIKTVVGHGGLEPHGHAVPRIRYKCINLNLGAVRNQH